MDGPRFRVSKDDGNVPWSLLVCLLVMSLVFVIAIPVLGFMYMDMSNATVVAVREINRMRELRRAMLEEHNLEMERLRKPDAN
jgi:hypothetical protein